MVHWKVLPDGTLVHNQTGYEICIEWVLGIWVGITPQEQIRSKTWATEEVKKELDEYCKMIMN